MTKAIKFDAIVEMDCDETKEALIRRLDDLIKSYDEAICGSGLSDIVVKNRRIIDFGERVQARGTVFVATPKRGDKKKAMIAANSVKPCPYDSATI